MKKLVFWVLVLGAFVALGTLPKERPEASSTDEDPEEDAAQAGSLKNYAAAMLDTKRVQAKLQRVKTALYLYNADSGQVPSGLAEVVDSGMLQPQDILDPWGHTFAFRSEQQTVNEPFVEEYEIFVYSKGPDGIANNADDIYL